MNIAPELQNHWLWQDKPYAKGQAWIDLLLLADSESIFFRGKVHHAPKGQIITSENELAKRWGWSRTKARNFLQQLYSEGLIKTNSRSSTLITISKTIKKPANELVPKQPEIQEEKQDKRQPESQLNKREIKIPKQEIKQDKKQKKEQNIEQESTETETDQKSIYRQKTIYDALNEKKNEGNNGLHQLLYD